MEAKLRSLKKALDREVLECEKKIEKEESKHKRKIEKLEDTLILKRSMQATVNEQRNRERDPSIRKPTQPTPLLASKPGSRLRIELPPKTDSQIPPSKADTQITQIRFVVTDMVKAKCNVPEVFSGVIRTYLSDLQPPDPEMLRRAVAQYLNEIKTRVLVDLDRQINGLT